MPFGNANCEGVKMSQWKRLVAGVIFFTMACGARAQQPTSLAFQRAEHLKRGINLSSFYAQTRDLSAAHLDGYMSVADMQALKAMGFDHVRLSIDPQPLIANAQTGTLRAEPLARLDKTVAQLTGAGLNVVLDIHAEEDWKAPLVRGDDGAEKFLAFWENFAAHYAKTDPERVFFEILNEPSMDDLYRWEGIQDRAVAAIRRVAPQHTILATAAQWGHQDGLMAMEPVRDQNVIYTFHDYDSMWFTHQGATWGNEAWAFLRGVPYPSTPENIQAVLGQEPDQRVRLELERYGEDRWNAARIGEEIAAVARWARERDVPLYCGEFGVYKTYADPQARATWISDMRTALESKQMGWAMWDYDGNFGLATKGSGGMVVDQNVLHALGLGK
jgi:aryl-phospho-beta-D-glucosidase BglC (GH1 family)